MTTPYRVSYGLFRRTPRHHEEAQTRTICKRPAGVCTGAHISSQDGLRHDVQGSQSLYTRTVYQRKNGNNYLKLPPISNLHLLTAESSHP